MEEREQEQLAGQEENENERRKTKMKVEGRVSRAIGKLTDETHVAQSKADHLCIVSRFSLMGPITDEHQLGNGPITDLHLIGKENKSCNTCGQQPDSRGVIEWQITDKDYVGKFHQKAALLDAGNQLVGGGALEVEITEKMDVGN
ncbi:hypothetical protein SLEP1_g26826 [Rubroshorea leprosula]|uniref:Uncharacterized protein n=1 Tax=Rubroshorea leprosula TaxID=152421 RepID=A0AAV5JNK4_9ROSI|nr:hypothetical protein SLEP1_g26826 [Rubroshorea leprosula]